MEVNPVAKNITEFISLATEAIIDGWTERKVLHLGPIVRKNKSGRPGMSKKKKLRCALVDV